MLNVFKSITDITRDLGGVLKGARGYIEKAGGKGLTGVVQEMFDLNLPGFIEETDKRMGTLVMRLTVAGETAGVETAVRFRNYAVLRLEEMMRMAEISQGHDSENPEELKQTVGKMADFLETREPETACSERDEVLRQEIAKLRKLTGRMEAFLQSEEALLGGEDKPAAGYPVAGNTRARPATGYPMAGASRKKPSPVTEKKAEGP